MILSLLLAACGGSQSDVKAVAPGAPAPPPPSTAAPTGPAGESRALPLDAAGGGNGAPLGMVFIVPGGTAAETFTGQLTDGSSGFRLTVPSPGDAVVCTLPIAVGTTATLKARTKVSQIAPGPQAWMGMNVELRGRGPAGELISPMGARYSLIKNFREPGEWEEWEAVVSPPTGSVKGEFCWRFVNSTGTVEVDGIEIVAAGGGTAGAASSDIATPVPATPAKRWELDAPGGANGAPLGFEFILPPTAQGVANRIGDVGGATGIHTEVATAGNSVVCSEAFPVAGSQIGEGRVKVSALTTDTRTWTGFVSEVRTYNAGGALISPPGTSYTSLDVVKAPGDWHEFATPFSAPAGATLGRLCFRFVESTGAADIDWAGVKPG